MEKIVLEVIEAIDLRPIYKELYEKKKKKADDELIHSAEYIAWLHNDTIKGIEKWYEEKEEETKKDPLYKIPKNCKKCMFSYCSLEFIGESGYEDVFRCSINNDKRIMDEVYAKKRSQDCPFDKP